MSVCLINMPSVVHIRDYYSVPNVYKSLDMEHCGQYSGDILAITIIVCVFQTCEL